MLTTLGLLVWAAVALVPLLIEQLSQLISASPSLLLAAAIVVGQIVDQVIQPRLMGNIVGLQPAWLLISLPIGARLGALYGVGDLLGLLLAVPVASCIKTLADAAKAGDLRPPESPHAPGAP